MQKTTEKLYYQDQLLCNCDATVIEITDQGLIFDRTVAYAEGGGQMPDFGTIELNGEEIPFNNVQKINAIMPLLENFPTVKIAGENLHMPTNPDDLAKFSVGDSVKISINVERRALISMLHSASHCAVILLEKMGIVPQQEVIGFGVSEKYARLDCATDTKFSPEIIAQLNDEFDKLIADDVEFKMYAHPDQPEAIYWQANDDIIPCGGTHVARSSDMANLKFSRKGIGQGKDRLVIKSTITPELISKYKVA